MNKKQITLVIIFTILFILIVCDLFYFFKLRKPKFDTVCTPAVNVVYITDSNYVTYMRTSIRSIQKNKNPHVCYKIYVIGSGLNKKDVKKILKEQKRNFIIEFIPFSPEKLKQFSGNSGATPGVTRVDNAKFFLTSILHDLDRVIYLDGDTIILKDLTYLYYTILEQNYVAAADDWQTGWEYDPYKRYFNNGIMLLNLKKMREDNIYKKLIEYKKNDKMKRFMTQDAFNSAMYGRVKYLPLFYNTFAPIYDSPYLLLPNVKQTLKYNYSFYDYPYLEGKQYLNDVAIIHYCGYSNLKPWQGLSFSRKSSRIWYKYAPLDFWLGCLKGKCKSPYYELEGEK